MNARTVAVAAFVLLAPAAFAAPGPRVGEPVPLDSAATAAHRARGLELSNEFMAAYRADRFPEARRHYADLRAHDAAMAADYGVAMFRMLRVKMRRAAEADSFARACAATMTSQHVGTLVRMVELILERSGAPRDLDLALHLATRARSLADPGDSGVIATLAEVQFRRGDVARAIETQQEAIAAAPADGRVRLEKTLARYRAKRAAP